MCRCNCQSQRTLHVCGTWPQVVQRTNSSCPSHTIQQSLLSSSQAVEACGGITSFKTHYEKQATHQNQSSVRSADTLYKQNISMPSCWSTVNRRLVATACQQCMLTSGRAAQRTPADMDRIQNSIPKQGNGTHDAAACQRHTSCLRINTVLPDRDESIICKGIHSPSAGLNVPRQTWCSQHQVHQSAVACQPAQSDKACKQAKIKQVKQHPADAQQHLIQMSTPAQLDTRQPVQSGLSAASHGNLHPLYSSLLRAHFKNPQLKQ